MKNKGNDYSGLIIWAAVLVTVVRYVGAFVASDVGKLDGWLSEFLSFLMVFSGAGMGLLDVLGGAYLFDGWRKVMPKEGQKWSFRFKVLTYFVFGIIGVGIGILVPFTVSRVAHSEMLDTLGLNGVWWWSVLVNIAPYLLIGGVSVSNAHLVADSGGQMSGQMRTNTPVSGQKMSGDLSDWRKARKQFTREQFAELAQMRTADIQYRYGLDERQARRWREAAAKELL